MKPLTIVASVGIIVSIAAVAVTGSGRAGRAQPSAAAKIEDLGEWTAHGTLDQVERFWALPSGQIAYSLWNPENSARITWARSGPAGRATDLLSPALYESVELTGMNSRGVMVGNATEKGGITGGAFMIEGGTVRWLAPPAGHERAWVYGLNDVGTVIGAVASGREMRGCIWKQGRTALLPSAPGIPGIWRAINSHGDTVVLYANVAEGHTIYLMRSGEPRVALKTGGWNQFYSLVINDRGDIAADAVKTAKPFDWGPHSVVLIRDGKLRDLGRLPNSHMTVRDLGENGIIVGYATRDTAPGIPVTAFMWDEKNRLRDLNRLIPPGSGWDLTDAHGIDANGAIFGVGKHNGQSRFFRLTIPN
jgi:hypothetical protein